MRDSRTGDARAAKEFPKPPRVPKGPSHKIPEKLQNVTTYDGHLLRKVFTLDRIPKSISVGQANVSCDILGTFLAGPSRAPRPGGPAEKVPKKCKTDRSWPFEIDF